jgi:glycosyltransferase involved in cell wall biosynthesis
LFVDPRWPLHSAFTHLLGPTTRLVAPSSPKALLWEQVALPEALRRERVDVFHAPADGGMPMWAGCRRVLTYHRALDKSVKFWIDQGDLPGTAASYGLQRPGVRGWWHRQRHDALRRLYLKSADRVIAVSDFGKWELVTLLGVPARKVTVIYPAADGMFSRSVSSLDIDRVRATYGLPERYLLFVGGSNRWKNVDGLIRAFARARAAGVSEALVLVGIDDERERLRALAGDLHLLDGRDVVLLDHVHKDLPAVYHGATAFITLSWGESFCLPVVEAMSCGTPVIASSYGALPEVIEGAGILVDPRSTSAVDEAIRRVTSDADLRADLRARGRRRASAFSWDDAARRTLAIYRELTEGVASGGVAA